MTGAFDGIKIDKILEILKNKGFSPSIQKIILNYLTDKKIRLFNQENELIYQIGNWVRESHKDQFNIATSTIYEIQLDKSSNIIWIKI